MKRINLNLKKKQIGIVLVVFSCFTFISCETPDVEKSQIESSTDATIRAANSL
jgi:hypothetical protein